MGKFWVVRKRDGKLYGNGQNHVNLYTNEAFAKSKATKIKGKVEQMELSPYQPAIRYQASHD